MALRMPQTYKICDKCAALSTVGECLLGFDNGYDPDNPIDVLAIKPLEECYKPRNEKEMRQYLELVSA